jgi:hypothetical protein
VKITTAVNTACSGYNRSGEASCLTAAVYYCATTVLHCLMLSYITHQSDSQGRHICKTTCYIPYLHTCSQHHHTSTQASSAISNYTTTCYRTNIHVLCTVLQYTTARSVPTQLFDYANMMRINCEHLCYIVNLRASCLLLPLHPTDHYYSQDVVRLVAAAQSRH